MSIVKTFIIPLNSVEKISQCFHYFYLLGKFILKHRNIFSDIIYNFKSDGLDWMVTDPPSCNLLSILTLNILPKITLPQLLNKNIFLFFFYFIYDILFGGTLFQCFRFLSLTVEAKEPFKNSEGSKNLSN